MINLMEKNYSQEFEKTFINYEVCKREIFDFTNGEEEKVIANNYRNVFNEVKNTSPYIDKMYRKIAESYELQSINFRRQSEKV